VKASEQKKLFLEFEDYVKRTDCFKQANIDRKEIVSALVTNKTYLYDTMKAVTGTTLMHYINVLRLEEVKKMLRGNTKYTIEQIADRCGFKTTRTLYRLFQQECNMSPAEYRRLNQIS
jgi:AraC-like DNA-binding protein